jgi:hypothetical protein
LRTKIFNDDYLEFPARLSIFDCFEIAGDASESEVEESGFSRRFLESEEVAPAEERQKRENQVIAHENVELG